MRHSDRKLYKPDIAVHQGNRIIITDISVNWEGNVPLAQSYRAKQAVYDNRKFLEAAAKHWPNKQVIVLPLIIDARGIWPQANKPTEEALGLTRQVKAACVNIAVKFAAYNHSTFNKRVWSRSNHRIPR